MTVEDFPQHTTKPKPTEPIDIIRDARSPEEMLQLLALAFPELTMGEVVAMAQDERRKLAGEEIELNGDIAALEAIEVLVAPVMANDDTLELGDALRILADQGNEAAAALLAQFDSAEAEAFERDLAAAVELDPYWSKEGRDYRCRAGATHTTPADLVEAYRQTRAAGQPSDGRSVP